MSAPTVPPPPPAARPAPCPICGTLFSRPATGRCARCGADLADAAVERIIDLDQRWRELAAEREQLVAQLAATRVAKTGKQPVAGPGAAAEAASGPSIGVPTLLALGGAALLTAAAVVFTAVAWTTLPALGQAAILLVATGLAAVAAVALGRRGLPTAAAALGVVAMAFAAVDVIGLDRGGLLGLGVFAEPAAAAVAGVVGWVLAHARLRWVSTAGSIAGVVAGVGFTVALADELALPVAATAAIGVAVGAVVAASAVLWSTRPARWSAAIGGGGWLTVSALVAASGLAENEVGLVAGLACIVVAIGILVAGARWADAALAPAALLVTAGTVATAAHLGAADLQLATVAAAVTAAAAWAVTWLAQQRRWWVLLGCAPAGLAVAGVALWMAGAAAVLLAVTLAGLEWAPIDPWGAATVALAGAALLGLPRLRTASGWVVLPVLAVCSGALPTALAWPLLLAVAFGAGLAYRALRWDPLAVLATAGVATGWAAGTGWTLAVAAAATAALAAWLAGRAGDWRARAALGVAILAGGLALAAGARAAGAEVDVALGIGIAVVLGCAVAAVRLGRDDPPLVAPIVAGLATLSGPVEATSARAAGILLLLAAVGWVALAVVGWRPGRWVASGVVSAGSFVLLGDAEVEVIEAYTAVPAVALAAAGLWWLVEDRSVRTLAALSPALSIGLVPSLVVLAADPRVLPRTLGLAVAAGVLALGGVLGRWLAPTIAGAVAAVGVAATQLGIVVQVAPRWATFAVIGLLLVWLAATYERQQQRGRAVAGHLAAYR